MKTQVRATELGRQAFHDGRMCAPALDPNVMAMLEGLPVGGGGAAILQSWLDGWTEENLAAPIEEATK